MSACHKAGGFSRQVAVDPSGVAVGDCTVLAGGAKKPMSPTFTLTVTNPPDLLLRDDDLTLVQEDDLDTILVDI